MKHASLILVLSLFFIASTQAQDCSDFFQFQKGVSFEYGYFDKKDKMEGRSVHEVEFVQDTDEGGVEAQVKTSLYDKKDELAHEGKYIVGCKDNTLKMDVTSLMGPDMTQAFAQMEVTITGDDLQLPSKLEVGQTLPDANTRIEAGSGGMKILTMTFDVTDRKVEAKEKVETPAGSFDCYKISHTMRSKMLIVKTFSVTEWYAEGVGVVLSETYDKKGNLESSMKLLSYKKL